MVSKRVDVMGWKDKLSRAWRWGVDTTLDLLGNALSFSGTLFSAAGGIGFAAAQELNKTFSAAYSGDIIAAGNLAVGAHIDGTNLGINYTLPLQGSGKKNGENLYNLTDYIDANLVYITSALCVGSGVVLKTMGDTLKKWQEYRYDAHYNKSHYGITLSKPSPKEFLLTMGQAFCFSVGVSTLSYTTASCVAHYSPLFPSVLRLTYPFTGTKHATGPDYYGPLKTESYPIAVTLDSQKIPADLPFIGKVTVVLNMAVRGMANATYGGGLSFKEDDPAQLEPTVIAVATVSGVIGSSAYLTHNFFAQSARFMRDNRIHSERRGVYTSIQDEVIRLSYNA